MERLAALSTFIKDKHNYQMAHLFMSYLASGLAHEMNNIFTAILGNISIAGIYLQKNPEKAAEKLADAEKAIMRARNLMSRVHLLSTKKPANKCPILLLLVLKDEINLLNNTSICLKVDPEEWNPQIECDEELFRAAIRNALNNAIEATGDAETPIIVSAGATTLDGRPAALITIKNWGDSMSSEEQGSYFIPYITKKPKASGLGLNIIRAAIELHGGKLQLVSSPQSGTTLELIFPLNS